MAKSKYLFAFYSFIVFALVGIYSVMGMGSNNAFKDSTQFPSREFYYVMLIETFGYVTVFVGLSVFFITKLPGIGCVLEQLPCTSLLKFIAGIGSISWAFGTYYLYKFYKEDEIKSLYNSSNMLGSLAYTQLLFPLFYLVSCVVFLCLTCFCKKNKEESNIKNHYDEL